MTRLKRSLLALTAAFIAAIGIYLAAPTAPANATYVGTFYAEESWIYNPSGTQFYRIDFNVHGTYWDVSGCCGTTYEYIHSIDDLDISCTAASGPFDNSKALNVNGLNLNWGKKYDNGDYTPVWWSTYGGNLTNCGVNYDFDPTGINDQYTSTSTHAEYEFTVNRAAGPITAKFDMTVFNARGCGSAIIYGPGHMYVYPDGHTCAAFKMT